MTSNLSDNQIYYKDLYFPDINLNLCQKIRKIIKNVINENLFFTHRTTHIDGLHFYNIQNDSLTELEEIKNDANLELEYFISALPPNFTMCIHSDHDHKNDSGEIANKGKRYSTISVPILPEENIASTDWFADVHGNDLLETAHWTVNCPKLLDIKTYHGNIKVGNEWRVNLQLSLPVEFEDAVEIIRNNKLFKTKICLLK